MLPKNEAMNCAMQICRALEHAHSKHVVHRDIKPQNIVLTKEGKIKVADFGIARAANNSTTVNSGAYAVGSAHYLSPEQARGGYTDNRSDIYSLGVVLYELFTGRLPFDAEESIGVVMMHINEEPPRPSEINPEISPGLEAIILRAMCKEQRLRYESATEILADIIAVYQNPNISVTKLNAYNEESLPELVKKPTPKKPPVPRPKKKKKKQSRVPAIIAGIVAVIAISALGIWWLFSNQFFLDTGKEYEIPDLTGMTFEEAATVAEEKSNSQVKFTVIIEEEVFSEEKKGTIISQSPDGGAMIKKDREISVIISRGPVVKTLPDYTGEDSKEVQYELEQLGIVVKIEEIEDLTYAEGTIISHLPSKGTQLGKGDEITLKVSKGALSTYVPDVVGKTRVEAEIELEKANLQAFVVEEASDTIIKDEVIRQKVSPHTLVSEGTVIEIVVSTGKPEVTEPEIEPEVEPEKDPEDNSEGIPMDEEPLIPEPKTVSFQLTELSTTAPTKVKILVSGVKVFEADITTSSGNATVKFDIEPDIDISQGAEIYYNNTFKTKKEVQ